jgi:hypothetical protein
MSTQFTDEERAELAVLIDARQVLEGDLEILDAQRQEVKDALASVEEQIEKLLHPGFARGFEKGDWK